VKPRLEPLERKVHRTIRRFDMIRPGERVLVALSGGADSTALLLVLERLAPLLGATLAAAHLDHRLRGEDSDEDARFVAALAAGRGVALVSETLDVKRAAAARRRNLEETAREARADFLRRAAEATAAGRIALGHTLNDQAETVLMRLLRGSGTAGLAAIHPVLDGLFIRPLIETSRAEIVRYLESRGASWREDASNRDLRFRRNRVRAELIPYLERHLNPKALEALGRHAASAREEADFLDSAARAAYASLAQPSGGGVSLRVSGLAGLHPALRKLVLRLALVESRGSLRAVTARHIDALLGLCRPGRSGRRIELPGGAGALRQFDRLVLRVLRPAAAPAVPFRYQLEIPGTVRVPEAGLELTARVVPGPGGAGEPERGVERACLDADLLPPALTVRSRLPGDVYGRASSRKVKKLLIDSRIPRDARDTLPMVAAPGGVVWIPGLPPAKSYAVRPRTVRCVILEAARDRPAELET